MEKDSQIRFKTICCLGAPTQTVSASQRSTHLSRESTSSGQVQVSQSVSAPARDADRSRRLGHEGKSSSVLSTDSATSKKPELKWTSKQTSVQSTGSHTSGKSVTSKGSVVSVSSADAPKSKRSEEPKDQTRKSVSSADSQRPETSKKRDHIESEQWTKVSYQKRPKFERYISKKEYSRRIQSRESQSTADKNRSRPTPGTTAAKRGRATCCRVTSTRTKKHVIGHHLPMEAYGRSGGLESETRMMMFEELLLKIVGILKC